LLGRSRRGEVPQYSLIEGLELIQSAGTRAADLVNQILTFSRKQPTTPVILSVGEVVSAMVDLLRTMTGPSITLVVNRNDFGVHVCMDRGRLEQVIVNLAVNARDAMHAGGKLVIETGKTDISVRSPCGNLAPGQYVTLSVSDNGSGISPDHIERIFEPFFSTKAAPGKGTGLGLSIVYSIVHQTGGHIAVESKPGQGTSFRILLPVAAGAPTPTRAAPAPQTTTGSETILICEDEADVLKLLRDILADKGYHVLTARDGREGLKVAADYPGAIALLLTDVIMPGLTGPQLAGELQKRHPGMKVLLISGFAEQAAETGTKTTKYPIIGKPFQSSLLVKAVRGVLDSGNG